MEEADSGNRFREAAPPPPGPVLVCRVLADGKEVLRQGRILKVYRNDVLAIEASDVLSPPVFFVKEAADWAKLTDWLLLCWSGARLKAPFGFRLLRPLPDEILDNLRALDVPERRAVLARLREAGVLPKALPILPDTLPEGVVPADLPSLCLLAPGEEPLNRRG